MFAWLTVQLAVELERAQEGKVYRLKTGKLQLLMASVMTSTPSMLSRNPARAWCEESGLSEQALSWAACTL